MSSKPSELALEVVCRDADACVLAVSGELSLRSAGLVTRAVSKALLDVGRGLVDVSGLRLACRPAIQLFPSFLAGPVAGHRRDWWCSAPTPSWPGRSPCC